MTLPLLLLLVVASTAVNERAIDEFSYADSAAARQTWQASSGTPAVEAATLEGRKVLRFTAPFAADADLPRTIVDRELKLDLSSAGEFTLDIAAEKPEAAGQISLYFRSGDGWYSGSSALSRRGWQTLRFSKASFRVEGTPAGWNQIDGVRVSVWRGQAVDSAVVLGRLAEGWNDVAVIIPAASSRNSEREAAMDAADRAAGMLEALGLGSDAVDEEALVRGALGTRRVAILAHNPGIGDDTVAALVRFVEQGGKVFACYSLPPRLGEALGFARTRYIGQPRAGHFAEIRLTADGMPGLPAAVKQASWNITAAEPAGHGARVIGRWFDDTGKDTGEPALLVSDRGAFLTHVLLADDRAKKEQLLAALLGSFAPQLWKQMAAAEIARAGRVGHIDGVKGLTEFVREKSAPAAGAELDRALAALASAEGQSAAAQYAAAVASARQARELLASAYLLAQPSRPREGRAWWNHSGTGAYTGDWERSARELSQAGFNMILPNMLWGGLAHYPSDVLPRSSTYEKHGDQIAQCVAACKKHGLEVHVWKVNWNLSTAPRSLVQQMRAAGRTQVSNTGEPLDWLCPSHPENQALELESLLEVARKYDVDGLHFDYIRYPGSHSCYCGGCRERFEAETKQQVAHWPADCYSGPLAAPYHDWRCQQITKLVAAVHREAKKIKPQIKISAAVFGSYPDCRQSVGQDWPRWVEAGYLDFVCPMDYSESDLNFSNLVANQMKLIGGKIPLYPGIGATASRSSLTPDRVAGQIHVARQLGADGFTIFNYQEGTAGTIVPALATGPTREKAAPPHQ